MSMEWRVIWVTEKGTSCENSVVFDYAKGLFDRIAWDKTYRWLGIFRREDETWHPTGWALIGEGVLNQ